MLNYLVIKLYYVKMTVNIVLYSMLNVKHYFAFFANKI